MEKGLLLVFTAFLIQGLWAAPEASSFPSATERTPSKEAELSQEFQRLKDDAEQFQEQVLKFTTAISTQLGSDASLRELISKVADTVTSQTMTYIKQVEDGANAFLSRVGEVTSDKGKEALERTVSTAETAIEELRWRSERMFNNGLSYLRSIQDKIAAQDKDSDSEVPYQAHSYLSYIENNLTQKMKGNSLLPVAHSTLKESDAESQPTEGGTQRLQRRDGGTQGVEGNQNGGSQGQNGSNNGDLTSAITQQYQGLRDSGVNVIRGVTSIGTGSIIGILDGLSAILSTTTEVSQQAKKVLGEINRSGAHAVTSVIGTAGSLVSGTLDRTGSVVESLRMSTGGANNSSGEKSHVEEVASDAGAKKN